MTKEDLEKLMMLVVKANTMCSEALATIADVNGMIVDMALKLNVRVDDDAAPPTFQ